MVNELRVFYSGEKGLMTFDNKKIVFQNKFDRESAKEGLGIIKDGSLWDKGNYAFAVFQNIPTILPKDYYTASFFANKGLPLRIEKGVYGDNVLIKEIYRDRKYIRAYKEDGTVGLFESEIIKNENYEGNNVYFTRINDLVKEWIDITEEIVNSVFEDIRNLKCEVNFEDENVVKALSGLEQNKVYLLKNGVIVADGKFENLVIWSENKEVKMVWLGRKFNFEDLIEKEITK